MKKRFSKLTDFWNEDRSLSVSFWLLLVMIFIITPLRHEKSLFEKIFANLIYTVIMLAGILSVAKNRSHVIIVSIFAVLDFSFTWLVHFLPNSSVALLVLNDLSSMLFNFVFAIAILIKTFKPGDITYQRIEGSIVVYLLFGLIFTFLYHAIYVYSGTSFNIKEGADYKDFIYFSFTTLTTTGYGDILPIHPLARSLSNFESVIGTLYPAVLIGRLVSMEYDSSKQKKANR